MPPARIVIGLITALAVVVVVVLVIDMTRKDVIAEGVRIGTLDVGGMDREKAHALVQRKLAGKVARRKRQRGAAPQWCQPV